MARAYLEWMRLWAERTSQTISLVAVAERLLREVPSFAPFKDAAAARSDLNWKTGYRR
jgi:hypothetical protein